MPDTSPSRRQKQRPKMLRDSIKHMSWQPVLLSTERRDLTFNQTYTNRTLNRKSGDAEYGYRYLRWEKDLPTAEGSQIGIIRDCPRPRLPPCTGLLRWSLGSWWALEITANIPSESHYT
ncbi:hypothetical protein KQX54_007959 [Cotesia glomerata]|uniref:Uncharacterized protein n=1 Tax=Cotesia glomerata TaxID=32391 RepID=A0AAV7IJ87_COTGL|nr:hypothetical protein KQX54_007959 [Cotesia glomerata]